ncbi:hypothetical protein B0H19DRAFT_1253170 [Mycena capillaripes]|nr:hypothetical protein B0H19DRAFT_1253170 [Mycena capillaripes]
MRSKDLEAALAYKPSMTELESVQEAILDIITSPKFRYKDKAWPLSQLPEGFWTQKDRMTPAVQDDLEERGAQTLRYFLFDRFPHLVPATEYEWTIVTEALTSPATIKAVLASTGHNDGCVACPLHKASQSPSSDLLKLFCIYIGATVSLSEAHDRLRIWPWVERHFKVLAEGGLKLLRPAVSDDATKPVRVKRKSTKRTKGGKGSKSTKSSKKTVLGDATNIPRATPSASPSPPAPPVYVHDPAISLSPDSCAKRRRMRLKKLCEVKARGWVKLKVPASEHGDVEVLEDAALVVKQGPDSLSMSQSPTPGPSSRLAVASIGRTGSEDISNNSLYPMPARC